MKTQRTVPPRHQQILYNQIIDERQPGTILHDFEVMLIFIQEHAPFSVTSLNSLLPMKILPQLNILMSHPLRLDLKRPQHRSFPNILGLYLLLRTTGLALIETRGSKQHLCIDEEILESWRILNPAEQYFMLLETALLRAKASIIDEQHRGGWFEHPLRKWSDFFLKTPQNGLDITGDKESERLIPMFPGIYNLALMQMFGLIEICDDLPLPGKGWRILDIHKTGYGDAVFQEISDNDLLSRYCSWNEDFEEQKDVSFGELQSVFQPFFPEWTNNLEIPEHQIQEGTHIFKVTVWKNVWRKIAIPGSMTLDRLADVIQDAFEFYDRCHLYRFIYTNRFGLKKYIDHPDLHIEPGSGYSGPLTDCFTVGEVPLRLGERMILFYDFGDQWQFEVLLEEIAPFDPLRAQPEILEIHGESPEQYGW